MNKIITISREFGSGGREFGCRLAENLGIKYYDKEIISKIASKADLSEGYVKEVVEKRPMPLFPMTIGATFAAVGVYYPLMVEESVYTAQTEVLQELAEQSDCVIVGRCADYICGIIIHIRFSSMQICLPGLPDVWKELPRRKS